MSDLVKTVREPALGTWYSGYLQDVDCDPRLKQCIFQLANDLHETCKRLNDCIEVVVAFNDALNVMAQEIGIIGAQGDALLKKAQ